MSDAPTRTAPRALWLIAQTFLNTLFALFGPPEAIAFQHTHTRQQRALLLPWLRAGEALMRRLLLLEASAFPKPNTRPLLGRTCAKRVRKLVGFDDDKPETWRVSFECFAPADRRLPAGKKKCRQDAGGPRRFTSAWPLAERYEALIRVFNNPAPFAKRLAARLHATPHRIRELMRLPVLKHGRRRGRQSGEPADTPDLIGAGFPALEAACGSSFAAFNSS
jgi:hypothetical protein